MIEFSNGGRLVQAIDELPNLTRAARLYCDFETTSGSPKLDSLNPWHNCEIAGICVTADRVPGAWYVPIRHNDEHWNLPLDSVLRWLQDIVSTCSAWVNHNVKYDAHCAARDGAHFTGRLIDTLTGAKIIDSDRVLRGGYGLAALSKGWLEEDIDPLEQRVKAYLKGCRSKDYGDVPADILGEYGCQDAITVRRLDAYIQRRMPEECASVWATEIDLTSVLYDMEVAGMRVDPQELQIKELITLNEMVQLEESLHNAVGFPMRPHVNADCFELLCNQHGLPVLAWTNEKDALKESNPSFDKDALKSYLRHPIVVASPDLTNIVNQCLRYRTRNTLMSLFIKVFQKLHVDGVCHPSYNQAVRTGRMSCRKPNAQQNSYESKGLVHPADGWAFLSGDYSQIEFRLIVHYIKDHYAIQAYADDPDTDFHQWVADMCNVPRSPAKNINFAMGYGGGKKRVLKMLSSNMELVGHLMEQVEEERGGSLWTDADRMELFTEMAQAHSETVFETYHSTLPGLKRTSRRASQLLKSRGFVRNKHGRHRHLPNKAAFRAFNSVIQSEAADFMKQRTVATSPRFNSQIRDWGLEQIASVHDETLFHGPREAFDDPRVVSFIANTMEAGPVQYRVPIRVSIGASQLTWAEASSDEAAVSIDRSLYPA